MLDELDIRDFVLAEHIRLHFNHGFTAITGETGAGKSLIVDALGVLLGDRPSTDIVRTGAAAAHLEGTFLLRADDEELAAILAESGIEPEDGLLIVSRDLPRGGRASARINGRTVLQSTLSAVGSRLVDIHSQTEHLAILQPTEHVHYIDRFAGTAADRTALGVRVADLRRVRAEIARLQEDARERTRRQERLSYEIQEIDAARIAPEEEDDLRHERSRLANAEQLAELATQAYAALEGDGETPGAGDALGTAAGLLAQLARLDENLVAEAAALDALQSQAAEIARTLRAYGDDVEYNPQRLQQIEDRLSLLAGLKRKYGTSLEEVLAYAAAARTELEALSTSEERAEALRVEEAALVQQLGAAARALSERRRAAATQLSAAVERQLADLGLAAGRFGVRFQVRPDDDGVPAGLPAATVTSEGEEDATAPVALAAVERTGIDRVELLVSLNRGEPLRPLARVASGGETSRLMLALKTVLGEADSVPTLVFDEVDVGVGGRSGRIVGEKLAGLAAHHQVICITHLPQIASLATEHLTIEKHMEGERTWVTARELRGAERLEEVAAMLGGATAATRASAQELLGDTQC